MITAPQIIEMLWRRGFFDTLRSLKETKTKFQEMKHYHSDQNVNAALNSAAFLNKKTIKGKKHYAQKYASSSVALKSETIPKELLKKLEKDFPSELADLNLNYGSSGTCTAFLLRKILEKLIYIVFTKEQLGHLLESDKRTKKLYGLEAMLDIVSKQKNKNGKHFLMPKTFENIKGIKFLGDSSAHNPLVNVDVETIVPVMPFIITAYKELASNL